MPLVTLGLQPFSKNSWPGCLAEAPSTGKLVSFLLHGWRRQSNRNRTWSGNEFRCWQFEMEIEVCRM